MSADVKEIVQEKYGEAARRVRTGTGLPSDCCSKTSCCEGAASSSCDPITSDLYDEVQKSGMPEKAVLASLGCGNPTALAELKAGETVLDLGSGGGIDVLLSAKRVGPTGKAYGLDMTDEMLALAEENKRKSGLTNVEFLKGEIENIPLPDNSVDVIISNCVINLSGDKDRVMREACRVLKPGGRFAVSDVVVRGEVPAEVRKSMELWVGCIAGALEEMDYVKRLARAGFDAIGIEPTRVYSIEECAAVLNRRRPRRGRDRAAGARQVHERLCSSPKTNGLLRARLLLMTPARRLIAELLGTALLLAAVVGSGIMGERLSGGNVAIALLANTLATGATLVTLILTFGAVSGAHFNPAVTLADASQGGMRWRDVPGYILAQAAGAMLGVWAAHLMFAEPLLQVSQHVRSGGSQLFSEFIATFGLLSVIWGCGRLRKDAVPFAVGLYITGAYWFTASTSFANPAVTLARSFTNTFAGIRPADAPGFMAAQLAGAFAATFLFRWLVPSLPKQAPDVVVPHSERAVSHGR